MLESPAWNISTNCKHLKIMSHIVNMLDLTQMENNMEVELIQENGNETSEQSQHFWPMHSMPPPTTFHHHCVRKSPCVRSHLVSRLLIRDLPKVFYRINRWGESTRKIGKKKLHTLGTYCSVNSLDQSHSLGF